MELINHINTPELTHYAFQYGNRVFIYTNGVTKGMSYDEYIIYKDSLENK